MIKLCIIDDHPVVLEGTKNLFKNVEDIEVDTKSDLQSVVDEEKMYDAYLIDINMPEENGILLSDRIRERQPHAIIILYTGDHIEDYFPLILERKIDGLLSKTATKEQILRTIRATVAGEVLLPSSFIEFVHEYFEGDKNDSSLQLNEREKKILRFVAKGYTNHAIALELQLTQRTIERNLSQIFHLLNVSSRTEAVLVAKEKNLI